jgi:6-phosphogluconolactonase
VGAFAVTVTGRLDFLNQRRSGNSVPPHLVVDATGRMLIAADYGAGTVCAWPILSDGSLGPRSAFLHDLGPHGPNPDRQRGPHAHSVTLAPDNRMAYVCDLGLDRVFAYRIDPARAAMSPAAPPCTAVPPGSGPRHSKVSPDGRFLYVVNEMGGSICVFARDPGGALTLRQTISTLPPGFSGVDLSAEIRIDRAGRFVYASNRGPDTLAVFARNAADGTLSQVEVVPCGGRQPRNFNLSPDGRWLVCANRASNSITVLQIDPRSGRLRLIPSRAELNQPICVLFFQKP